jgi:hypothetical protein
MKVMKVYSLGSVYVLHAGEGNADTYRQHATLRIVPQQPFYRQLPYHYQLRTLSTIDRRLTNNNL